MQLPVLLFHQQQNNCITFSHMCLHVFTSNCPLSLLLRVPPSLTHPLHFSSQLMCSVSSHSSHKLPKTWKLFLHTLSLCRSHSLYKVYEVFLWNDPHQALNATCYMPIHSTQAYGKLPSMHWVDWLIKVSFYLFFDSFIAVLYSSFSPFPHFLFAFFCMPYLSPSVPHVSTITVHFIVLLYRKRFKSILNVTFKLAWLSSDWFTAASCCAVH